MSDRRQDDMAAQAWPGYVDILSATVIMFVFFVMVIVVVLYLYTIKFTSTVQQQAEKRIQETIEQIETPENLEIQKSNKVKEISDLEKQKQTVKEEVQALEKEVEQLSAGLEAGRKQKVIVNEKTITILFTDNAISLTNDTINEIVKFLALYPNASNIDILAGDNPLAVTQSSERKTILARMLNVRNIVLDKDFRPDQITINYVEPEQVESSYNWVKMVIR